MTDLLRCNVCFRQPSRETSRFAITNCGHVVCELCLQKGKKEECGVCRSQCRIIFLSNETNSDIKMLFMDINVLCKKFSKDFMNIIEFQDSHRRRSVAHYKGKITTLEETIKELTEQLENFRTSQPYSRLPVSGEYRYIGQTHFEQENEASPYSVSQSRVPSVKLDRMESMALSEPKMKNFTIPGPTRQSLISPPHDGRMAHLENQNEASPYSVSLSCAASVRMTDSMAPSAPKKKNFTIAGPTRLSLISPPQDGHMGHVPYRSNTTGSLRSAVGPSQSSVFRQLSQPVSQTDCTSVLDVSSQRTNQMFLQTPLFTPTSSVNQPITIANILQRRHQK